MLKVFIKHPGKLGFAASIKDELKEMQELVGGYIDENKLKRELETLFSAYEFLTSDSYTELIPFSVFKEFKNPAEDMVKYLKGQGLLG